MSTTTSTTFSVAHETNPAEFDSDRHEKFGERVVGMLNDASLSFMLSIGHRSDL